MNENIIKRHVVGVDVSVDLTTYAIVDMQGGILAKETFATSDYLNVNEYVSVLSEKIIALVEQHVGYESIRSVGVSAPSGNFITGSMENASNMPWKGHVPLAAMLRTEKPCAEFGVGIILRRCLRLQPLGERF